MYTARSQPDKRDIQTIGGQIIEVQLYYILYIHFGDQLILLGKSAWYSLAFNGHSEHRLVLAEW